MFVSDTGSKKIVIGWNDTLGAWTISGQTPENEEIIRFISQSDVSSPVKAFWSYLSNGTENEIISAPLMHVKGNEKLK